MNIFYDMGCPDSRDAYYLWKSLLPQDSHIAGKKYSDLINMRVSSFVLPYHIHSWAATKVLPYLQDLCAQDSTKCFMNTYSELCWDHWNTTLGDKDLSQNDFVTTWSGMINAKIPEISAQEIQQLFSTSDTHNVEVRSRYIWKYAASNRIAGAPQVYINGVKLDEYPMEEVDWKQLL